MRRSTSLVGPVSLITLYYGLLIVAGGVVVRHFSAYGDLLPFGGIDALLARGADQLKVVSETAPETLPLGADETVRLLLAIVSTVLLMVPVSWVYFITTRDKDVSTSFAQTIMVLPVIVAGIAMIVHGSLALAFSLAGVVAAVRFRFTLDEPAQALYIFGAIAVGLAAGISAVGIATVVSAAFVYLTLALWRIDYGDNLTSPFFAFLTGRGRDDNDL
ncbi:MAG: DUF4956 domain-containing protein [Pseudomonadales bacterium]